MAPYAEKELAGRKTLSILKTYSNVFGTPGKKAAIVLPFLLDFFKYAKDDLKDEKLCHDIFASIKWATSWYMCGFEDEEEKQLPIELIRTVLDSTKGYNDKLQLLCCYVVITCHLQVENSV
jgi:hypothetical protein